MTARRCEHELAGGRRCGLTVLGVLDGIALCSQHLYAVLARRRQP